MTEEQKKRYNEFRQELAALLEKYNATINVDYDDCSDMHGVTGEGMSVSFDGWPMRDGFDVDICYGWGIEACDLKTDRS